MKEDLLLELSQHKICNNLWKDIKKNNDIPDTSRIRRHVIYRHSFVVAVRKYSTLSTTVIGGIIKKDHATVIHACKQHEGNYNYDINYKSVYYLIDEIVRDALIEHSILKEKAFDENLYKNKDVRERMIKLAKRNRQLITENKTVIEENNRLKEYAKQVNKEISALKSKINVVAW